MSNILEQYLSLIDLGQLEKEIKTNPDTKFEEKDIEAIKNGDLNVIIHVAELYATGSSVIAMRQTAGVRLSDVDNPAHSSKPLYK